MSRTTLAGRAARILTILVFLGGVCSAKTTAPITASLDLVSSPTAGGACTVLWSGIPRITPQSADVVFQVTAPGAATPASSTQPITMTSGRTAAATFRFTTAAPGVYTVIATARMVTRDGRWADARMIHFEVPAAGQAKTLKLQPQSAADYDSAVLKSAPKFLRAPSYLSLGAFTVSGTLKYTDKVFNGGQTFGTAVLPIRHAKVEIHDKEGSGSVRLASTTTNDSGYFSYTLPNNNDGDGTGYDIFLRVIADGAESRVTDMNLIKSYYYQTLTQADWAGGALNLGTITLSESASAPWNIYDCLIKGADTIKSLGSTVPKVSVAWARNNDALGLTHYNPIEKRIYLQGTASDPDEFDDAVILHEYSHHIANTLSYDKNSGIMHSWAEPADEPTAWSEGWADFFSSVVRSSRYYYDSSTGGISIIDLESPTDHPLGAAVEGAVASSLWDIFDQSNDHDDYMYDRMGRIWAIVSRYFTSSRDCVVRDFYNAWISYVYPYPGLVEAIFNEHGINYGWTLKPLLRSLLINSGAASTSSRDVLLNNVCGGSPKYYLASESSSFTGAIWRSWSAAAPFTLSAGNGTKTIYMKVKDAANNASNVQSDSIVLNEVTQAPKLTSFKINNGAATAYNRTVTLNNTWTAGTPYRYMAADNPKFVGAYWYAYSAAPSYTLSAGNGTKTIYFKIKTSSNLVSNVMTDTIALQEVTTPVISSLKINNGAASSSSRTVTLNNVCTGGPTQYLASENPSFSGAIWKTWSASPSFTITSGGNGSKTIYFKVRNAAGTQSLVAVSALITLNEFTWLTLGAGAVTGNVISASDYDLYQFVAPADGWYTVRTNEGGMTDAYLYLDDSAGKPLAESDNQGAYLMPMITEYLKAGTYLVSVYGATDSDIGTYTITARSGAAMAALDVDSGWAQGNLTWINDVNWFQFTVDIAGTYTIETAPGPANNDVRDAILYLYKEGGVQPLAVNDDVVLGYNGDYTYDKMPTLSTMLPAGTYRIAVLGWSETDLNHYTIQVRGGNQDVTCTTMIVSGLPVTGYSTSAAPDNYFMFTIDQRAQYTVASTAGTLTHGQMQLYKLTLDASNSWYENPLKYDGNSTLPAYMPKITQTLDTGLYLVWFSGDNSNVGTYGMTVKFNATAKPTVNN